MRLTEQIDVIEQRMIEERAEDRVAMAVLALGCFLLLALCWVIAAVWP